MSKALNFRKILLFLGDMVLLYISLFLTVLFGFWRELNWEIYSEHLLPFSILYFFWLIIFYIFGLYELDLIRTKIDFYQRILSSLLSCLIIGMIFFYSVPLFGITPKTNLILNIVIFGVLIFGWRKVFYSLFSAYFLNNVIIIGKNTQAQSLAQEINSRPYLGYKLIKIIDENSDLLFQIRQEKVDTVILGFSPEPNSQITENLYQCLPLRLNFLDLSQAYEIIAGKIPISSVSQAWFLENLREREKEIYDKIKRVIDIILATFLLIITSPLWPFIALFIKLEDRGPIFYKQERIGKDRKSFFLYKFRSMKIGAEEETGPVWAKREDPRITRVGKFLRKTHLDELPQMINVIKGDISLVGPRPERSEFVQQLKKEIPHYHLRHLIKPGFTGWAQIKFRYGRSVMDSKEKFEYDLYYLKNRNFLLDTSILLKTFQLFFKKE